MSHEASKQVHRVGLGACAVAALAVMTVGCGGAVTSGSAVGRIGQDLAGHAHEVPRGGEVCAAKEGLAAQPGGPEKPIGETCAKSATSDQLWRRSLGALAAYGETLDAIAGGGDGVAAGSVQAARTGIDGDGWIQVDAGAEKSAAQAAAHLVGQLRTKEGKDDLEKTIRDAAPHVRTICDGLVPYLDGQATALGEIPRELEKKRANRGDRRCTTLDSRSVCVSDSASDRVVQALAMGHLVSMESAHLDARDAVAGFCAAHGKLADAAAADSLGDETTNAAIADAVRSSRKPRAAAPPAAASGPAPAPAAPPPAKK